MTRIIDNQGIAMAEAVIVLPFFILVWVGMLSVYNHFNAKLGVQTDAARMALRSAGDGVCGDVSVSSEQLGAEVSEQLPKQETGLLTNLGEIHPLAVVHVNSTATREQEIFNKSSSVSGQRTLCCNTKPVDGLMALIVDTVGTMLGL